MKNETPPIKRPVGRPRTTLADIPHNWDEIGTDLAQQGAASVEIMCALGIYRTGYATLIEDCDEFRAADTKWQHLCEQWWHRQGREMTTGKNDKGQATVWKFNMANRFRWRDKFDHEIGGNDKPIKIDYSGMTSEQLAALEAIAEAVAATSSGASVADNGEA